MSSGNIMGKNAYRRGFAIMYKCDCRWKADWKSIRKLSTNDDLGINIHQLISITTFVIGWWLSDLNIYFHINICFRFIHQFLRDLFTLKTMVIIIDKSNGWWLVQEPYHLIYWWISLHNPGESLSTNQDKGRTQGFEHCSCEFAGLFWAPPKSNNLEPYFPFLVPLIFRHSHRMKLYSIMIMACDSCDMQSRIWFDTNIQNRQDVVTYIYNV